MLECVSECECVHACVGGWGRGLYVSKGVCEFVSD